MTNHYRCASGLIADSGGEAQIRTATRILAEIIRSDVALLVTFNQAIEGVIKNNQEARSNPKALAQSLQQFFQCRSERFKKTIGLVADLFY